MQQLTLPLNTEMLTYIAKYKNYTLVIFWDILANVLTNRITCLLVKTVYVVLSLISCTQ